MTYQTGSSTNMADLISKLNTFAAANGWTIDEHTPASGRFALHKGNCYTSFRWDTATPLHLSVHQALGYTGGQEPGAHPNDSGNGYNTTTSHTNANLATERCVHTLGNGAFTTYHFFEDDNGTRSYIHIVVQISAGVYRHFGFGMIDKFGNNWTGGEYAYGHLRIGSPGNPININDTCLLDGLFLQTGVSARFGATLHCEGLPGQGGTGKWGQVWAANTASTIPDDTATVAKIAIQGGFRAGLTARTFGWIPKGATDGMIPAYPITLFYRNTSNNNCYLLGSMPDVRGINIRFFAAEEELTVGADTWVIFPLTQKTAASVAERSYNSGIAYKKIP